MKHTFRSNIDAVLGKRTYTSLCQNPHLSAEYGAIVSGSYPMSASIRRVAASTWTAMTGYDHLDCSEFVQYKKFNQFVIALQNSALKYTPLSPHFNFAGTIAETTTGGQMISRDLTTQNVNMIDIPSIYYGETIKRGSVILKYYITGNLMAEASDIKRNGELIETTGSKTGTVIGLIMYDEGIMMLTASHALGTSQNINYGYGGYVAEPGTTPSTAADFPRWYYFGYGCNDGIRGTPALHLASASFGVACKGTSYINSMTLFCHAQKNKLDYSNNPTFIDIGSCSELSHSFTTSSYSYVEQPLLLKNVVSSSFLNYSSSYEKTTYLSKIGIYDEQGNLIMIASMAKPVKKTIQDEYTFKLTLDI